MHFCFWFPNRSFDCKFDVQFKRHKNTTFINAHLGWMGNDLKRLGNHLDEFPNVVTEFGAVIAELGRQPKTARQFFIDYQDRIMFGKDSLVKLNIYVRQNKHSCQ